MSLEQLKSAVASLSSQEQAELIAYALQLRYAGDQDYRHEVTDRLNRVGREVAIAFGTPRFP
jgi:hypothetical protein